MKYTIEGFQQKVLLLYGLDAEDAVLLRFIVDFYFSKKMEIKVQDNREWFWLTHKFTSDQLPILNMDKRKMAEKLLKMTECGLLDCHAEERGGRSVMWFSLNEDFYMPLVEIPQGETPKPEKKEKFVDPATEERREIKEYFRWLYLTKAIEVTGSDTSPEGRKLYPVWGAKESSLLLKDYTAFGKDALKRFMRIFFSDSDNEVAAFTRYRTKAGYGYSVFHGSLPKLSMNAGDAKEPCRECGHWKQHAARCSVEKDNIKQYIEMVEQKDEHETRDIDLIGMFDRQVRLRNRAQTTAGDATGVLRADAHDTVQS